MDGKYNNNRIFLAHKMCEKRFWLQKLNRCQKLHPVHPQEYRLLHCEKNCQGFSKLLPYERQYVLQMVHSMNCLPHSQESYFHLHHNWYKEVVHIVFHCNSTWDYLTNGNYSMGNWALVFCKHLKNNFKLNLIILLLPTKSKLVVHKIDNFIFLLCSILNSTIDGILIYLSHLLAVQRCQA